MAVLNYPSGIGHDTDINPGWIEFSIYERRTPKTSTPFATINLYLPESMHNPNTVTWGNSELGFLGSAVTGSGFGGIMEGAKLATTNFITGIATSAMRTGGSSISSSDLLGARMGTVKNPYLTAMFKGVDFRTFDMSFKFSPSSEKDCDIIDNIIKTFRGSGLPQGKAADNTAFLGYPREFEIRYIWRGGENKYLHKFKRCVLTGIDVNYTGTGQWTVMRNGFPASINLNMRFSEIEIVLRDDVMKEGY